MYFNLIDVKMKDVKFLYLLMILALNVRLLSYSIIIFVRILIVIIISSRPVSAVCLDIILIMASVW